ncbi:MAG: hypothetical protein ACOYIG_04310 [Acetivibrionales bacterium]|jgi:hypothetical protein|nr:hypothetical protein [Clostridiaceae bacterium]
MMNNLDTYKIWAPDDALWTQWAKPVLFMHKPIMKKDRLPVPEVEWIENTVSNTMIIVDLPGQRGVTESLALARLGYRPVPLYNGVNAQYSSMVVPVYDIVSALFRGANELCTFNIRPDAPPVFMLDSNRMNESGKQPGKYDNRWCVFPQDMPSAAFIIKEGIHKVIVRSDSIRNDLSHILHRYQEEGIPIYLCTGEELKKIPVVKPSRYKSLSYRFLATLGLTRNATGGFGGMIPEPTQSNYSGSGYYRFG